MKIFGSDNDVRAFGQFVERYLKRFDRWNSPKFLFGESYGTPRSAMLVDYLQNQGIGINGVVPRSRPPAARIPDSVVYTILGRSRDCACDGRLGRLLE